MAPVLMFAFVLVQISNKVLAKDFESQIYETLATMGNTEVEEAFVGAGVVPGIITKPPPKLLMAAYDTANVSLGNNIFPTKTVLLPRIDFEAESGKLYTFLMLDMDAPSQAAPVLRSYIIAMFVNIPNSNVRKGFSAAPYIPATPDPGSGPHRYVLLVYEQCAEINIKDDELISLGVFRWRFRVQELEKKCCFTKLVAGNYFVSEIPKNFAKFC